MRLDRPTRVWIEDVLAPAMRIPLVTKDRLTHVYAQDSAELVTVW